MAHKKWLYWRCNTNIDIIFHPSLQDNLPLSLDDDPFFKEARQSFEKVRERMRKETDEFWDK